MENITRLLLFNIVLPLIGKLLCYVDQCGMMGQGLTEINYLQVNFQVPCSDDGLGYTEKR